MTLKCPMCDASYTFQRDSISICPSCGHEIQKADPSEDTPRIRPSRKAGFAFLALMFAGIVCLFFGEIMAGIGIALIFASIGISRHLLNDRCGNCGAGLADGRGRVCPTCGASLTFTVS